MLERTSESCLIRSKNLDDPKIRREIDMFWNIFTARRPNAAIVMLVVKDFNHARDGWPMELSAVE